ncbi:MAG: twitching motility protein PilT [Pedosphaera sp. Tous-C6FEB]|nr:MAG: twitching motility protein PilT [Pedosphaera sp. Tous-C6FEB]
MSLWAIRIVFLILCTLGGFSVSQVRPEWLEAGRLWVLIGFGFGGMLIALDEMLKGFSLRAFSAATFGLLLGAMVAWMFDNSGVFMWVDKEDEVTRSLVRMGLFIAFGYIGMIMAMRSNKEDFALLIPYIRFTRENKPDNLLLLDTSVIIDGRIADLIDARFLEGIVVVPSFVLKELQLIADSSDSVRRARGRRGLDMLARLQRNKANEVKIHEAEVAEILETDAKLIRLAQALNAVLYTNDHNLGKVAELQSVKYVNLNELAAALKPVILPGEVFTLKIVREGKDRGQGVGYLSDGTLIVVNNAQRFIGQQIEVQIISLLQSATGTIAFADPKHAPPAAAPAPTA